jgi:cytochrome c oxidase subunit 1
MVDAAVHEQDHEDKPRFFTRWFMSTNHKDIGILHLFVSGSFVVILVRQFQLFTCGWNLCTLVVHVP